ncbi:hypothetical protein DSL64_05135 [Dyadobacter luteus]|uniref:Fibronectin type-III domain-containing protein n=1 Tax=Dyadobacter luteus TaxID=2259619 RepID=A0A3D8YJ19_9BACT|nr:choice-of-anchor Q domain-containing protein [Dyadobacter luteus]REA63810.1 hypothetical protein DSL64_05135 [Dyadobacter luteus]
MMKNSTQPLLLSSGLRKLLTLIFILLGAVSGVNGQKYASGKLSFNTAEEQLPTLFAFGIGLSGRLGTGNENDVNSPVAVNNDNDWKQVSAGGDYSLAVKSDGSLWAWGNGNSGRLGTGNTDQQNHPVKIGQASNWGQVSAGSAHSLAIKTDGTLWAWGSGNSGRLGAGNDNDQDRPVQVGEVSDWVQVIAGFSHSLALKSNGTLWAWGSGSSGRLGTGNIQDQYSPVQIGNSTNWTQVSTSDNHSLALKADGTLWAWGSGSNGKLGTGNTDSQHLPVQVGEAADWMQVSAGRWHSVALKSDGTLWAWGTGNHLGTGNSGNDEYPDQHSPVQVGQASDWRHVSAGQDHTLAIKADGTLWSWGHGADGALGTGNTIDQHSPVRIGDQIYTYASAGGFHSLALRKEQLSPDANGIFYIRKGSIGNGSSWENAASDLTEAVNDSRAGQQIWVAAGEYQPSSGQSFSMKEGVKIYGGFPATGSPAINDRDYASNVTTLKGNNASVVYNNLNFLTNAAILDGFTITGGSASEGGGIYNRASSPLMRNLVIKGNSATSHGGGIALSGGSDNFRLENSLVTSNTASAPGGGIYVLNSSSPVIVNVTISGNTAGSGGSGVTVERSNLTVHNSIIWSNSGTALNFQGPGANGRADISYSLVQGSGGSGSRWQSTIGTDNGHNIDTDPLFIDPANSNYTFPTWSPVVNAGNTALLNNAPSLKDISGNARIVASVIDLGAYENQQVQNASVRYVRQGATGNGYSWEDASGDLQVMINSSGTNNEIWVASGEYQPASGQSFSMKESVKIYGGFPATGNPTMNDRNYATNVTILKGNNASVVYNNFNFLTNAAILDGFTITGGHAGEGGGIYNRVSSPLMRNLIIKDNTATSLGGAVAAVEGSDHFRLENSLFTGNTALGQGGGMYVLNSSSPTLLNVTISGNTAGAGGSGVSVERSYLHIQNSIVWGNTGTAANFAGPVTASSGAVYISYSLIQGSGGSGNGWQSTVGTDNGNNLDVDPGFLDAPSDNYSIPTWSPAVNAGSNALLTDIETLKDLSGSPRVYGNSVDMGAFENQQVQDAPIRYVRQGASGNGYSWSDASGDLQAMINSSTTDNQVWVAAGEYQPASGQSFSMKEGVKIYGGFPATGSPAINDRNYATNVTTLKGNNASVVYNNLNFLTNAAILDGFTITGGSASEGGGIYNRASSPLMRNLVIKGNSATSHGGGIALSGGSDNFRLENSLVTSNTASAPGGGIYVLNSSSPVIVNVTISGNTAGSGGSGVTVERSNLTVHNSIIWSNSGTALNFQGPGANGRADISYSLVQGSGGSGNWQTSVGSDNGHNLDTNPLFKDAGNNNYQIAVSSPAVNAGNSSLLNNAAAISDLAGEIRIYGVSIDMGAYEAGKEIFPVRYVRQNGGGNGGSWENASGDLQAMINAEGAEQVWVAAGEYKPASGQSFSMKEGVKIYGGFSSAGTPAFTDRNWNQNVTTLKGNGKSVIVNDNNGLTKAALLDGFTITGGSAVTGGGMLNHLAYPLINHCVFRANNASVWGGGIYNDGPGMTTVVNSLFIQNTAQSGGAAFSYQNAKPRFTNVTLVNNTADQNGGALHNYEGAETELVNCIVWGNMQSTSSSQLYTSGPGKTKAYFSVLEGGENAIIGDKETVQAISQDPLFTDATNGNFTLQGCSPALNIGTGGVLNGFTTDLNGNSRFFDGIVDAGAYEYQLASLTGADRLSTNGQTTSVNISAGQIYYIRAMGDVCRSVAVISSNGDAPVNGIVNVTTHIDNSVQTYNGSPYLQRYYDISPANSSTTATARVTLYFTQEEFSAYNTSLGHMELPSGPNENPGRLRVFQYHGLPKQGQTGPAAYQGTPTTITPELRWHYGLARWEVSFDVKGFSGFFIGSAQAPLPVKLVSFEGILTETHTVSLQWRVTEQVDMDQYSLEYSNNGKDFTAIGNIPASKTTESRYEFTDTQSHLNSIAYYRLRMSELDGSYAYSRIIGVKLPKEHSNILAYPIPAHDFVRIKGKDLTGTSLKLVNTQGVVLKLIQVTSDDHKIDISSLPAGVYLITTNAGQTMKIVKN